MVIVDSNYIKDSQKHQMFATRSKADQQTMDLFVNHNYKSGQVYFSVMLQVTRRLMLLVIYKKKIAFKLQIGLFHNSQR